MNLIQLRLSKSLTLQQVADKMKISISYLSRLENSKRTPTIFTMKALADAYNVDITEIFRIICNTYNINYKATKEI